MIITTVKLAAFRKKKFFLEKQGFKGFQTKTAWLSNTIINVVSYGIYVTDTSLGGNQNISCLLPKYKKLELDSKYLVLKDVYFLYNTT